MQLKISDQFCNLYQHIESDHLLLEATDAYAVFSWLEVLELLENSNH